MYIMVANKNIKKWLEKKLEKYIGISTNKYIDKVYMHSKFVIKLYSTNTLTIEGQYKERIYDKLLDICEEQNFIGEDEVGVGDFFGPTVYCSVLLDENTINALKKNKIPIKDSKKLNDNEINKIYNNLKKEISFEKQIIYDKDIEGLNSIEQKLFYHNQNYIHFLNKIKEKKDVKLVIDLFTTEKNFYKRSNELNLEWPEDIMLETKADSKYISVAIASIMARGIFLEEIKKISENFKVDIPLGTNSKSIEVAKYIINQTSKKELEKICKITFKTYKEL